MKYGYFNDDPLWLIACTSAYIRETGDLAILDEMCAFDSNFEKAVPLMEHLRRSFNFTVTHTGPHGLPLIGRADQNDCLNLNCFSAEPGESFQTFGPSEGPVAESVFIGGMFVKYGHEYADLCRLIGLTDEADACDAKADAMAQLVQTEGWDGEWFIRAFDAYSNPVGSHVCEEGQIYIEPQGMCIIADIGLDNGKAETALKWPVTPEVLYYGPRLISEHWQLPVVITENGLSCNDVISLDGKVHDPNRIDFLHRYLKEMKAAVSDGCDLLGYFHWAFTDNYEWHSGYSERFGLIYVDYPSSKRIPKDSADWYRDVISTNGENL